MIINSSHPTFRTSSEVLEISKPLKQLGITYFEYTRNEQDGGRIWLANHPSPTECYLKKKYYLTGNMESMPVTYISQIVFLETLPKQHIYEDTLHSNNFYHGMKIINPHKDYCEFFVFATTKENIRIINTYLTKLDVLKKFCTYFLETAAPLIKLVEKNKVTLPFHNDALDFIKDNHFEINQYATSEKNDSLTKRQYQCAQLLIAGKTMREMASILNLSPRTVEHYLNHLKVKFKCKNKSELIVKLTSIV